MERPERPDPDEATASDIMRYLDEFEAWCAQRGLDSIDDTDDSHTD